MTAIHPDDKIILSEGYSRNQLKQAFEKVQNKENWKLPTNEIWVETVEEAKLICRAVTFYTGGKTHYYRVTRNSIKGYFIHSSEGYYYYIGA